ncbi:helix-turn-helix domain-containing protein [Streptomyces sp. NPDC055051]
MSERTACRRGHPYPENKFTDNRGWSQCRQCARESWRRTHGSRYVPVVPDEIAVERAVSGDPPARLTPRERAAAVRQLNRRGYSASQIAERVGCTPRTVYRIRSRVER